MPQEDKAFSEFMKELRMDAGLSIEEAARGIGVGVATLESWERGLSFPSDLSAQRISAVYGIPQQEWLAALKKHRT